MQLFLNIFIICAMSKINPVKNKALLKVHKEVAWIPQWFTFYKYLKPYAVLKHW